VPTTTENWPAGNQGIPGIPGKFSVVKGRSLMIIPVYKKNGFLQIEQENYCRCIMVTEQFYSVAFEENYPAAGTVPETTEKSAGGFEGRSHQVSEYGRWIL
jgi:hypothetical protein